jgi:sterol desaturase/sphingolipid hydroxylase (fatty acid hydroxylase superfamily)
MALWEMRAPRRALTVPKTLRWVNNLGLAAFASAQGWGLLNHYQVPFWLAVPLSLIAMDFVIWLQHVMVHAVPVLWRLHRVHHADPDYDLTTGARFHPIEIILSMLVRFAAILVLGPPLLSVILFEVILNGMAMFNHGNVRLPDGLDRALRWLMVTPDMHRVHHSVECDEANSNFGFNLAWWDRLFGTYKDQPSRGHQGMTIGIHDCRDPRDVTWLPGLLALPFRGKITGYAINLHHGSEHR